MQCGHSPNAIHWATPFTGHPFDELKLTEWLGGVAYNTHPIGEVIGSAVSALSQYHDQLLALIMLLIYLDRTCYLSHTTITPGNGVDINRLRRIAADLKVVCNVDERQLSAPGYCFHYRSRKVALGLTILSHHAKRINGPTRPDKELHFFTAMDATRQINSMPMLGLTYYQK